MPSATIQPKTLAAAAATLQAIGSAMAAENAAAAIPTTRLIPAAADEVSALTATQFGLHGTSYQAISDQAAAIHQMFTAIVSAGASSLLRQEKSCLS
ncbi:PE family protein [Mycobacterium branderi]|uniref:PE family protein n=1 Tax=Mycobacterium branderi TaxID=43348 RepID=A0A7I7WEJ4_9MYCO|nr:PE family protein [Mycobacterium branderi]MCV7232344.1 PE family protein [Mycobacterium branderi]ORA36079.1 PE family protein [Mycobacterium branderi]BBZ14368.1 PE family protein [Mycobacterium branderi]